MPVPTAYGRQSSDARTLDLVHSSTFTPTGVKPDARSLKDFRKDSSRPCFVPLSRYVVVEED